MIILEGFVLILTGAVIMAFILGLFYFFESWKSERERKEFYKKMGWENKENAGKDE